MMLLNNNKEQPSLLAIFPLTATPVIDTHLSENNGKNHSWQNQDWSYCIACMQASQNTYKQAEKPLYSETEGEKTNC